MRHTARRVWGHTPPENFLVFRGTKLLLRYHMQLLGNTMLLVGQMTQFHMYNYLHFVPIVAYSTAASPPPPPSLHKLRALVEDNMNH